MEKRIIRLTESDIQRIVKRVIKEQDYMIKRDDSYTEPTKANTIYLVSNGNTYDVWTPNPGSTDSRRISFANLTLPMESEMGVRFDGDKFINNISANLGNDIAKLIVPDFKMSSGNWVVFTKNNGIPAIGRYTLSSEFPIDVLKDDGKKEKRLRKNQVFTPNDYFVSDTKNTKNKFGRYISFSDIKDAEESDI